MRSSSRLGTPASAPSMRDRQRRRAACRSAALDLARRIEAHMEQLEEIAGEAGMAGERVGQVAQAERRAELAQVGGISPERGRLAPVGAGRDDQAVEPVVVGIAARARPGSSPRAACRAAPGRCRRHRSSPAPCRAGSRRARRRQTAAGCDRSARRWPRSPCSPAPARARTGGSARPANRRPRGCGRAARPAARWKSMTTG